MDNIQSIQEKIMEIKNHVFDFLKLQQSDSEPTYFRYSLSGDLWDEHIKWNVQGRVFAARVAYVLGIERDNPLVECALKGIASFQHANGYIYDDMLLRKKRWQRFKQSIVVSS